MASRPEREVELHRLELRFAATRVADSRAVQRLVQSIDACGQRIACIAVGVQPAPCPEGQADATALVLIDGYRRVAALRKLGRDTALVEWLELRRRRGRSPGAGPLALARLHGAGGGAAAARSGGRSAPIAARGRAPVRARCQLGAAAAAVAGRGARSGTAGGVPRADLHVVGGAGVRAVGARQRPARAGVAGQLEPVAAGAVHARAQHLVRPIPVQPARPARTHGRAPALVHRQPQRTRTRACGQAIEGRAGTAGGGGAGSPASPARTRAQGSECAAVPGSRAATASLPPRVRGIARG